MTPERFVGTLFAILAFVFAEQDRSAAMACYVTAIAAFGAALLGWEG